MSAVTRSHNGMQVAFLFVGNGISRRESGGVPVTEDGKSKCTKRNNDDDDDHDSEEEDEHS